VLSKLESLILADPYMEDGKIIKGRKGSDLVTGLPGSEFIITNSKTIELLKQLYTRTKREEKLKRILKNNE